ncbi:MAG: TetR/AcrR family transcriptional regulator [Deltaproteobacteria bacterium]|nr:TetR/AcrR family transcriptional regulator [Deltaproteobacteria bacterium]MBW2417870.1 TetR/AcrR family transcriptional regulator [Deltaproteobacteria bacterium]
MAPSSPQQTRTQRQGARSREKILDAAEQLMGERGFAATSISAIRKESGLPASSIYWHFESKEGLLAAVMERGAERWLTEFGNPRDLPGDARQRLHAYIERGFSSVETQPPDFLRLSILLALERKEIDRASLDTILRVREQGRELFGMAIRDALPHRDPQVASQIAAQCTTFALSFMAGSYVTHFIEPEGVTPDPLAVQLEIGLVALAEDIASRALPARKSAPLDTGYAVEVKEAAAR